MVELVKDAVKDKTYVKLCVNKAHMGPVDLDVAKKRSASKLSAAANKIRLRADLTVSPISSVSGDSVDKDKEPSGNKSYVLFHDDEKMTSQIVAKYAVLHFEAWHRVFGKPGTPDYLKKMTEFTTAQSKAYASLGINPAGDKKPELNHQQRNVYNQIVGPVGFDYYEYHLAFKMVNQKGFTRTTTYRSLRPLSLEDIHRKVKAMAKQLSNEITVAIKVSN
jgi:hypothetical protein